MWIALQNLYQRQEAGSSIIFFRRLFQARLEEGGDIAAHLQSLKSLRSELLLRGAPIPEDLFCSIILSSLVKSYDALTSQIVAGPPGQLAVDVITQKLLLNWIDVWLEARWRTLFKRGIAVLPMLWL